MFLSMEQAENRLNDPNNLVTKFGGAQTVIETKREEFHRRTAPLPAQVRANIAADTIMRLGTAEEIAEEYGVHPSTVNQIKREAQVAGAVNKAQGDLHELATQRTLAALGYLDDDKLSGASAKDLSSIVSNLTKVMSLTSPKEEAQENVRLIVMTPEMKSLKEYTVIDV